MTVGTGTTGTANTVNIVFTVIRQIVVEDVGHSRNVQTTCRNVGSYQDIDITFGEIIQNTQAFLLRHIACQQAHAVTIGSQMAPDIFTAVLGVSEDDRAIGPLFFQQRLQ